jgi:hypothetical protein
MCETTKNNNNLQLHRTAGSDGKPLPPETGIYPLLFPVDPDVCVTIPIQSLTLAFPIVKLTFQKLNLMILHL